MDSNYTFGRLCGVFDYFVLLQRADQKPDTATRLVLYRVLAPLINSAGDGQQEVTGQDV